MKICPSCLTEYDDQMAACPRDGAILTAAAGLAPGTIIRNKYQIVNEIARGGMGVVYRARHVLFNEDRAIKLLLNTGRAGSGPSHDSHGQSILAEALLLRQLQHPNVVRIEDVDFTEDGRLFVVMELVGGVGLRQRMGGAPLPWDQALDLAAQACAGLEAAHRKGIIHRDIKPQNLLLSNAGGSETLKVIDLGIAKAREGAGAQIPGAADATVTSTGAFLGTPEYASPEQAMGTRGSLLDARTDIYSLGLVLYEMLTGARPFQADSLVASLVMRVQTDPPSPAQARPDLQIPAAVSTLVMKAIAKDKETRFASAREMLTAIDAARHVMPSGPVPSISATNFSVPSEKETLTEPANKSSKNIWIAAPAAAGILALAGWFFWPRAETVRPATVRAAAVQPPIAAAATKNGDAPPAAVNAEAAPVLSAEKLKIPAVTSTQPAGAAVDATTSMPQASEAGAKTKVNPGDGLTYIWIAPGTFSMGCSAADTNCGDDEKPAHAVTITKGFWLGQTEVTQTAYEHVIGVNPSSFKGAALPVDSVNWPQANSYCKAVDARLPTEAEWEFAARGGLRRARYANPGEAGWWRANSGKTTHEVKQKEPNPIGLYDLLGNVAEWTADWFAPYSDQAANDPIGPATGEFRILRGGSWTAGVVTVRASARMPRKAGFRGNATGFRCASD